MTASKPVLIGERLAALRALGEAADKEPSP